MENKSRKKTSRKTVLKPPVKNKNSHLSRDEVRSINKKKMSRRRKLKKNMLSILLALVVMCVGLVLVFSLFFKINTVTISGDKVYSDKMVADKSGIEIGENLFKVSEAKLSEKLSKDLPYIKSVTIERKLPDTIIINVEAAKEVAAVTTEKGFVLLDETGKVLDKNASILKENVAVINNVKLKEYIEGEKVVLTDEKKTEALIKLFEAIKNTDMQLLTEIDLKNINDIKIKYDDRITFAVGSLTNIETKLARGVAALEKENEINAYSEGTLDLKTEPYVYFKSGSEDSKKKENAKK
ncbi:MAG: FtsQ-type POTRA domain-containing protein [Acutalibacteraceae bacterium]|nr:FtsQ-type POTRA domain-containing protein [Acutalibacteraceae bacterium]